MIECEKTTRMWDSPWETLWALDFKSESDRDLAARILEAFQWAEAHHVGFGQRGIKGPFYAEVVFVEGRRKQVSVRAKTLLGAVEALRAKLELDPEPGRKVYPTSKEMMDDVLGRAPDKRVPAELWSDLRDNLFSGDVELRERLEACPDITDEPATLHPTAQAVLEAVTKWDPGAETDDGEPQLIYAWNRWDEAGRPTVVPGDNEDAATLQALRRCRELGLEVLFAPSKSPTWRVRHEVHRGRWIFANSLPEAIAAYKAAQAKVEDGWYWVRHGNSHTPVYREVRNGEPYNSGLNVSWEIVSDRGPAPPSDPEVEG